MKVLISLLFLACSPVHGVSLHKVVNQLAEEASGDCPKWIKLEGAIMDSSDFVAQMEACADRPVLVEINSPGGSVFDAIEIQKAIERHPFPVTCVVDGMAASAAFVTLQACHVRAMTSRSILMAHHASFRGGGGQSQDLDNAAAALRAIDQAMVLYCANRMMMSYEDFESHVSGGKEWWLAVTEAVNVSAVDIEVGSILELVN